MSEERRGERLGRPRRRPARIDLGEEKAKFTGASGQGRAGQGRAAVGLPGKERASRLGWKARLREGPRAAADGAVPAGKEAASGKEGAASQETEGPEGWSRSSGALGSGHQTGRRTGEGMATTHTWMSTFTYMSGWDRMVRPEPRST